jgi:hypothetical protein
MPLEGLPHQAVQVPLGNLFGGHHIFYKAFHQIREILVGRLLLRVEQINFSARHRERISLGVRYVDGFAISTAAAWRLIFPEIEVVR